MQINKSKYLRSSAPIGQNVLQERGELIVWFRDILNVANKKDGKRQVTAPEIARRLGAIESKGWPMIKTHDLGRDLYFLKKKVEEALDSGFPVGAAFYGALKRLRGEVPEKEITSH